MTARTARRATRRTTHRQALQGGFVCRWPTTVGDFAVRSFASAPTSSADTDARPQQPAVCK